MYYTNNNDPQQYQYPATPQYGAPVYQEPSYQTSSSSSSSAAAVNPDQLKATAPVMYNNEK
jgi:hypothetical protein